MRTQVFTHTLTLRHTLTHSHIHTLKCQPSWWRRTMEGGVPRQIPHHKCPPNHWKSLEIRADFSESRPDGRTPRVWTTFPPEMRAFGGGVRWRRGRAWSGRPFGSSAESRVTNEKVRSAERLSRNRKPPTSTCTPATQRSHCVEGLKLPLAYVCVCVRECVLRAPKASRC